MALTIHELSTLALVASDMSYQQITAAMVGKQLALKRGQARISAEV